MSSLYADLLANAYEGGFQLYYEDRLVNPMVGAENKIILMRADDINDIRHKIVDDSFHVASFTRSNEDVSIFHIDCRPINNNKGYRSEIDPLEQLEYILYNKSECNVILCETINSTIIECVSKWHWNKYFINSEDICLHDLLSLKESGIIILMGDVSLAASTHNDTLHCIAKLIKCNFKLVCNITWLNLIFELFSLDIELEVYCIYNGDSSSKGLLMDYSTN